MERDCGQPKKKVARLVIHQEIIIRPYGSGEKSDYYDCKQKPYHLEKLDLASQTRIVCDL